MPYIIRNQQGAMVGHCTNKPGPGNKLPDGSEEVHDFYEDEPAKAAEVAAFRAAQEAKANEPPTIAQKLASVGLTIGDLRAELAK